MRYILPIGNSGWRMVQNDIAQTLTDTRAFGRAVRAARKGLRLTQQDLADTAGVGARFISELERGKETVQLGLALHVARLVGLEIKVTWPTSDVLDGVLP